LHHDRQTTHLSWHGARRSLARTHKENTMLYWSLTFLALALIAAVLGFGGIAGAAAGIAKILFVVFAIVFVLGLLANTFRAAGAAA
jgi:uncharacterized membrane protein YtjA (UPF0391 family)